MNNDEIKNKLQTMNKCKQNIYGSLSHTNREPRMARIKQEQKFSLHHSYLAVVATTNNIKLQTQQYTKAILVSELSWSVWGELQLQRIW